MDISADEFLEIASKFKLGFLPTEQGDPLTEGLGFLAQENLAEAVEVLRKLDLRTLDTLRDKLGMLAPLQQAIQNTIA
jgi:hypothetical protein